MDSETSPYTDEQLALAANLGSATLHEAAGRIGVLPPEIRPVYPGWRIAGRAFPVLSPPGDNLWIHRALYAAQPGDIVVVATGDQKPQWGYWGEILSEAAMVLSLGGLILEGGSRDHAALPDVGFPVFSLGVCIRGTIKDKALDHGRLGEAIEIGGVPIAMNDLVVADIDGVAVIPGADASTAIAAGERREHAERELIEQLRAGASTLDLYGLGD